MKVSEIKVSYSTNNLARIKIKQSNDIYKIFLSNWDKDIIELQEEMKVVFLNKANEVLGLHNLSKGGTSSTIVDVKLLLSIALKCNAHSIVICHNHPSGNLIASKADIEITNKIKKACSYFDIILLDHLIISLNDYYSFSDEGML